MRYFLLFILPVIVSALTSCGKKEERVPWPARITSMEGFSTDEESKVHTVIGTLNEQSGEELILESNTKGFPITIKKVDGTTWPKSRAGYAILTDSSCTVELSKQIFINERADYIESVLWHELGHCSGLAHDSGNGEIMSATTAPFSSYSSEAVSRFLLEIKNSAGL